MNDFIEKYSKIWNDNPISLMSEYNYLLDETDVLDRLCLNTEEFNREKLYEIMLWKLNRLPVIDDNLIKKMRTVSTFTSKNHRSEANEIVKDLLIVKGMALPMVSTILRFLNPSVFQIIDDRAFRVVFSGDKIKKYQAKPQKMTEMYLENTIEIYFKYLDKLHSICSDKLPFDKLDRILYQLDIKLGNKIGDQDL